MQVMEADTPYTQAQIDSAFTFNDMKGNSLICVKGNITIKLAKEDREPKSFGIVEYITYKGKDFPSLVYSLNANESLMSKKHKAWMVCYEIAQRVEGVVYYVNDKKYGIRREMINLHGQLLPYGGGEGIDKAIYVPIENWKITSVK